MKRCQFCETVMNDESNGEMAPPKWVCPTCGAVESYGLEELPDPEKLRHRAEDLYELAAEIEDGESVLARKLADTH